MGEDADFYFRGKEPDPRLVAKLRGLDDPPEQAEVLAAIIERRCGHALQFGLFKDDADYSARRRRTLLRLRRMQKLAAALEKEDRQDDVVWTYSLCLDEVLAPNLGLEERQRRKAAVLSAIGSMAELPLRNDLEEFHHRPGLSDHVREVVRAVAEYWTIVEGKTFGGGVDREAGSATIGIRKGTGASLVAGVLVALSIKCTPSQTETHVRKVREELAG